MQSGDKSCTCNWDCNKVKALSGQINCIYNIPLPCLFHPMYYSICYGSIKGWNLFCPVGLVDCWHYGVGRIARIKNVLRFFSTSAKSVMPNVTDCKPGQVLSLSIPLSSSHLFCMLRMCRELRQHFMWAPCCKASGRKSGKVFPNGTSSY